MSFPSLEEYSDEIILKCDYYNGIPYLVVNDNKFTYATHWFPRFDEVASVAEVGVQLDTPYRLLLDAYDNEYVILDDSYHLSLLFLAHNGDFAVFKGSNRWNKYIKHLYTEEYMKTDEYEDMLKSSF